jgi:hypothetical protein
VLVRLSLSIRRPRLVTLKSVAEIALFDETAPDQKVEGPVHGGGADGTAATDNSLRDFLRGQVLTRDEDGFRHSEPLIRHREVVVMQVTPEGFQ